MIWIVLTCILGAGLPLVVLLERRRNRRLLREMDAMRRSHREMEEAYSREFEDQTTQQETLFDRILSGVLVLDGEGRVQRVNSAIRHQFDLDGKWKGRTLLETIRSHQLEEIVRTAIREGKEAGRELEFNEGMEPRHYSVSAARIRETDADSGVILLFHDLTRFKRMESGRKEFVANVSHELRTPVSLIKGYVETIIESVAEDSSVREQFLRKIHKHANRLAYLIEDLLALSQLESGRIALNCSRVSLSDLVRRVFEELQDKASGRSVSLSARVEDSLEVWADGDRLFQVFQNLVDNGIKYGSDGGEVSVQADSRGPSCEVRVADDGPGIPPEARKRIFERFFRVDKARSREQGGTGLGLAIVKHIVQAHGGQVWLEPATRGSIFAFSIPRRPRPGMTD